MSVSQAPQNPHPRKNPIQQGHQEKVQIVRFDDYITEQNINKVDFIKMDVENFEYEVLKGTSRVFDELRPTCLFEFSPHIWQKNEMDWKPKSRELLSYFLKKDYYLKDIDYNKSITEDDLYDYIDKFNVRRQSNILASFTS